MTFTSTPTGAVARDRLIGYAKFCHRYTRDEEFWGWFTQLEHHILALLIATLLMRSRKRRTRPRNRGCPRIGRHPTVTSRPLQFDHFMPY